MKRRATLAALAPVLARAQVLRLRLPGGRDARDARYRSMLSLFELLFEAAGIAWVPEWVNGMSQGRIAAELRQGGLDIGMLPNTHGALAGLPVLRHPLRRGLLGVRLLLARAAQAEALAAVTGIAQLRAWRLGYGADWPDLPAMRAQGFDVVTGASYQGLFEMLALGRFDWLHRGVNEVWNEIDTPGLLPAGLVVVPRVALFYPLDDYLCLRPGLAPWLPRLQQAWARIQQDGRYARWYRATYGPALRRAALGERRVLHLAGYGAPPGTPLEEFDAFQLAPMRGELSLP